MTLAAPSSPPHPSPVGRPGALTAAAPCGPREGVYQAGGRLSLSGSSPLSLLPINTCLVQLSSSKSPRTPPGTPSAQHNLLSPCSNISSFAAY